MRTNIEIDDKLMKQTMKVSKVKTKREAVEWAMRRALEIDGQGDILKLFGKVRWEGNLEESRMGRNYEIERPRKRRVA